MFWAREPWGLEQTHMGPCRFPCVRLSRVSAHEGRAGLEPPDPRTKMEGGAETPQNSFVGLLRELGEGCGLPGSQG